MTLRLLGCERLSWAWMRSLNSRCNWHRPGAWNPENFHLVSHRDWEPSKTNLSLEPASNWIASLFQRRVQDLVPQNIRHPSIYYLLAYLRFSEDMRTAIYTFFLGTLTACEGGKSSLKKEIMSACVETAVLTSTECKCVIDLQVKHHDEEMLLNIRQMQILAKEARFEPKTRRAFFYSMKKEQRDEYFRVGKLISNECGYKPASGFLSNN